MVAGPDSVNVLKKKICILAAASMGLKWQIYRVEFVMSEAYDSVHLLFELSAVQGRYPRTSICKAFHTTSNATGSF
jgi:hypothetical protein